MKKLATILVVVLLCCAVLALGACGDKKLKDGQVRITVGGESFIAELTDVQAAKQFKAALPMTLEMNTLNAGNTLYADLGSKSFAEQPDSSEPLNKGDIILRGNNRLELCCGFGQPESVTRIGRVREQDLDAFIAAMQNAVQAANGGKVTVTFSK